MILGLSPRRHPGARPELEHDPLFVIIMMIIIIMLVVIILILTLILMIIIIIIVALIVPDASHFQNPFYVPAAP